MHERVTYAAAIRRVPSVAEGVRMRKAMVLAVMLGAMSLLGCKKQVPTDIVQKSLRNALRLHAPQTTSGMCGASVKGLINANVTNVVRGKDGTSGTAHVSGAPWAA